MVPGLGAAKSLHRGAPDAECTIEALLESSELRFAGAGRETVILKRYKKLKTSKGRISLLKHGDGCWDDDLSKLNSQRHIDLFVAILTT